jgi:adenine-specific DNA-methyltransferase
LENNFYEIGLEPINEYSIRIFPPKSLKNSIQFVWRWGKEKSLKYMNQEIVGYEVAKGEYRIVQKMRHDEKIIRSLLFDNKYSSRKGTAEVEEIFNSKSFTFPKPLSLLNDFAKVGLMENDIILDFFSGSATTAHAVMKLNAEDGGNRKFIMVQLPEKTDEKSEAYKAGYENICEIGKERIRRAGKKVKEENAEKDGIDKLDIGFRVLKLDSSNMKDVYYTPQQSSITTLFEENIKSDRTAEDLLFQVMLEHGIELSAKIETKQVNGKYVHFVDENYLIACFDTDVNESTITGIAKLQPIYFVMRDSSANNDNVIDNFEQIFRHYSPETTCKII